MHSYYRCYGCQKEIAKKIVAQGADYVFGLKGNQGSLYEDVCLYFETGIVENKKVTNDRGHGRFECRVYVLETGVGWLSSRVDWCGLNAVGMVRSTVEEKGKTTVETRFFVTSLVDIDRFVDVVRGHWGVETSLYYCLDVTFGEDANCTCKDNSAENFVVVCHIALNVLKKFVTPRRVSLARKRRKCQYDAVFMAEVLLASIL